MKTVALVAACCLHCTPLLAAANSGDFAVDGVGSRSCADFTTASETQDTKMLAAFASWTDGFSTAFNVHRPDTFDVTPWQTVELLLLKAGLYCKAMPQAPYIEAIGKLIATLDPDRLVTSSEVVRYQTYGQGVFVYRDVLERVREKLAEAGHAVTEPAGQYGEGFAQALRAFQVQNGLPENGLPDQPTLNALFP